MSHSRVLVIDDDRFLLGNIDRLLSQQGFVVRTATSGDEGLRAVVEEEPDIMILDLGLPGIDGLSLCRRIRAKWRFPILMLTARTDAMDKVIGLEVGADDYLTKPFEPSELVARVRAQLRRSGEYQDSAQDKTTVQVGSLTIDFAARDAFANGAAAGLTTKEFELLAMLAQNAGRVLSREELFERVWGFEIEFSSNSLEVFVYRIRQKLEQGLGLPKLIHTVRGYGYKITSHEP